MRESVVARQKSLALLFGDLVGGGHPASLAMILKLASGFPRVPLRLAGYFCQVVQSGPDRLQELSCAGVRSVA